MLSLIVLKQTLTMSLYMLAGFLLFKTGKLTESGSKSIASLLVWAVIPGTIVKSCLVAFSPERLIQFAVSFVLGVAAVTFAMVLSRLLFPKNGVEQFGASFSNAGFIGIPLVQASFGDEAVFFLMGFVIYLNIMQWTYGVSLLKGEKKKPDLRELVLNPISIASLLGILLFVTGLGDKLPAVLTGALGGLAGLNGPLAMIVLGVYLAQSKLEKLVTNPRLWKMSAVRLVGIPLLTLLLLAFLPVDRTIRLVILTASAAPVGANVAIYSQLYDRNYAYACQTVTHSTVLSILALPLFMALCGAVV